MLRNRSLILILCLLAVTIFLVGCSQANSSPGALDKDRENLRVHFIDVGQGDSILIQTPHNGENILIDGGTREAGAEVVNYLKEHGVEKINLLIVTHPHEDHLGGLLAVLDTLPVEKIIDSGRKHTSRTYKKYLNMVLAKKIPLEVAKNQQFSWEDGVKLTILGPVRNNYDDINNYSVVAKLTYGKISFLFTGDMEKEAERDILDQDLKANILKIGHHGSRSSTSAHFLRKVQPEIAIISLGTDNEYGHPHQVTLKKLEKSKIGIYRTDLQGTIKVITDGKQYSVEPEK